MQNVESVHPEASFAALVDELASDLNRSEELLDLLCENHPLYDQCGTAQTIRMRGWVLLALSRSRLPEDVLIFVLEELDTGNSAYLVAAAARALRSYAEPRAAFAPFVMRALKNVRLRDEPVSFEAYGEYAISATETSAVSELLKTLEWLGPHARSVVDELESLRSELRFSKTRVRDLDRAIDAIQHVDAVAGTHSDSCCLPLSEALGGKFSWLPVTRRSCKSIETVAFEDESGELVTFKKFFYGRPSIVVFFYTRCDNPLKCSLTVSKLARIQELLQLQGLQTRINTAGITYDPAFDLPERLRGYGQNRGLRFAEGHRLLRPVDGGRTIRKHFKLGVNFIESLVNRHRIELYILDSQGRIASSFERIHWDEEEVVNRARQVLVESLDDDASSEVPVRSQSPIRRKGAFSLLGGLSSLGVAFFPKCPICWSAYLSLFGIAGLNEIPYAPWLQPILAALMLINLASVWLRARATGRLLAFYLVCAGAVAIVVSKVWPDWKQAAVCGVALTLAGSMLSVFASTNFRRILDLFQREAARD